MSRAQDRADFDLSIRLRLLEQDLDQQDEALDKVDGALEKMREELKGQSRILIGILVSVATAAILLAVNIAVQAQGG